MLLFGPPFNRSLEEIGWLSRKDLSKLALSHRDDKGILDLDMVKAEERSKEPQKQEVDPYEFYRSVRRDQAVPEYIIDKEIHDGEKQRREMEQAQQAQHNKPVFGSILTTEDGTSTKSEAQT